MSEGTIALETRRRVSDIVEDIPFNKVHLIILIAGTLGFMFDAFDFFVVAYALPLVGRTWQVNAETIGLIGAASAVGMGIGNLFWGPICDRWGRKLGFLLSVLGFSLLTGLSALAWSPQALMIFRFMTGLFLGGALSIDTTLVIEFAPKKYRGKFLAIMASMWPIGSLLAAISARFLAPIWGWRILFVVAALPAFFAIYIRKKVPETPRWLAVKGHFEDAAKVLRQLGVQVTAQELKPETEEAAVKKVTIRDIFGTTYRKRTIMYWVYFFFASLGYYGFSMWLPSWLASANHLDLVKTFNYTILITLIGFAGRIMAILTTDKWGRKAVFAYGFGLAGAGALLFRISNDPIMLLATAMIIAFFVEQGMLMTGTYGGELYPSAIRATGNAWGTAISRAGGFIGPVLFGYLLSKNLYGSIFLIIGFSFWIAVLLVLIFGPETKLKALRDVDAA